jgi:hypothetical protein
MSQYFDKDFFKFLLGFVAIILLSCVVILAARLYESGAKKQPQSITNVANPKP